MRARWDEDMPDYLEAAVDKFIFRVATDRLYSPEGVWALAEGDRIRVGMTDFLQQRSGDVAFAEVRSAGRAVAAGDEVAVIETIKANVEVSSPVSGAMAEVNLALAMTPEVINQDPYGEGWLAVIEASDWPKDRDTLLDPQAYFELMKGQAEEEAKKL
jgi:glycine cleavage system H protein